MVHLSLSLHVPQGQVREISDVLRALARRVRQERGCAASDTRASVEHPDRLFLHEEWTTEEDLVRYVRSDDFTQVLAVMELATGRPVLEFRFPDHTRELDYVAEIRADLINGP